VIAFQAPEVELAAQSGANPPYPLQEHTRGARALRHAQGSHAFLWMT
jgi:hypothetical protein